MTKQINLNEALKLYGLLRPYFPVVSGDVQDVFEFSKQILENIRSSGNLWVYVEAVMLLTGFSLDELKISDEIDVFHAFATSLLANQIFELLHFCRELENARPFNNRAR